MLALIAILTGPTGRGVLYAAGIVALLAGGAALWHQHDNAVRNALLSQQATAQAAVDAAQHQRVVTVLGTALVEQRDASARLASTLEAIHDAPDTNACIRSLATDAFLRSIPEVVRSEHP